MIAVLLMACASRSARAGGVTVITHGYESVYFGYPGWVDSMGDQVAAAAEAKGLTTSRYHLVIGHTLLAGPYQTLDATSSNLASGADEVIVTVDWAAWADHLDPAYGSHVNTADIAAILATDLLATLPSRGISSPLASRPLHLIGHSRGASVMMETARILGSSGIWVDHLTTLDPHPLTGWDLALKPDPPAHLYENVIFADNYWRDGGIVNGQQIVGAEDLQLADSLGHSDVHTWYHGTIGISGSYPLDDGETPVLDSWYADPYPARDQIGFFYSRIANGSYFLFSPDFSYAIGTQFGGGVTREVSSRGGGAQWANIGNIKIQGHSGNGIPQGQPITATYKYQDRDSQVRIDWFVDSDANPGNLPLVSQTRDSTGDKADNSSVTIFTDSLAIGTWRLRAKITSLNYNNTVRYEYADNPFSITYPDFVLKGIAPDSIEAGAGVTRLTLQGSSFGPSDKVLFSNGTSTTTVTPLSIMSDQIVVDFDFGTTVRTWDIAVRQYLDDIPLRTSASRAVAVASSSPNGPSITQQPADATLTFGQTNTFSVAATGSGTLSYQWKRNNLSIAGATSASFTTSAVAYANDGFTYRVFVTDDTGTTSSRLATLHVVAPTIAITDPSEPNDSPTQATALPLGVPTNGLIASTTDVDWYIVTLPTRGQLNVKLAVPPGLDYDIELYSSDLTLMAGSYNQAGENEAIQIPDAFGVYYVRVYGYPEGHGAYSQSQPYQLTATTAVDLPPGPLSGAITSAVMWSGVVNVSGDVTINGGGSLTILPGTQVRCVGGDSQATGADSNRVEIIVNGGTLNAVGTSDAPITFTSAGAVKRPGDWYGIRVRDGDVALQNCVVEYAVEGIRFENTDNRFFTYSLSGVTVQRCSGDGVWTTSGQFALPVVLDNFKLFYNVTGLNASGPVTLTGGQVSNNSGYGISAGTLVATNASVTRNGNIGISCSTATLTNCTVSENTGKGVSCGGAATLTDCTLNQNIGTGVTCGGNSTLTRCTAMSNQGDGVYGSAAMTIDHCTLSHNTGWGLNVNPRSWPGPYAADIWDSMMQSNGSGGAVLGTEAVVGLVNNVIVGNGGVGLYLNLSTYNCSGGEGASGITGNSIHDNGGAGVLVQGNQPPVLTLSGNDIYQNTAFELRNESGIPIVANNNYWGNPTTSEINASQVNLSRIYDWNDNASYGHVSIQGIRNTTILQAPQIISQPQSIAAQSSESVTLSVSCTGTDPITYQWYQNGNPIAQATASELVLGYLDAGKAGSYQVVATNVAGSATSAAALVTLILPPAMPEIVRQPVSQTVVVGASVNLTVIATGTAPLTYQWCRNGTPIAAAASATLNLASARVNDAAVYTVTVSNSAGSVTSQPATLTVNMIEGTTIARQILRSGTIYTVTVMVVPPVGTPAYLVEEVVPAGFTVGNISNLGGFDVTNSRVTWGPFWDGMPRTLVYTLESPAGFSGTVAINGMALFYGATAATAGDTTITIAPPLVTARLEMGEFYGYYTVSIFGAVGSTYVLEASDNMQDPWEEIGTLKLNTSPRVFVDLDSPTKSQRFYRAKWVK